MAQSAIDYNGHRLDELSQVLLQMLRDNGGSETAGSLRAEAGLDGTGPVHYRMTEHLGPAGLAERAGTEPRPGNSPDAVIYGLTDEGVDFTMAHEEDLIDAVAAAEAVETLRRIRATVDRFDSRVSDVEESAERTDAWKNRWSTRLNRAETTLEEKADSEGEVSRLRGRANSHSETLNDVGTRLDEIETRLDRIESQLEEFSEFADLIAERLKKDERKLDGAVRQQAEREYARNQGMLGGRFGG